MKKILAILLLTQACTTTSMEHKLQPVSPRMTCEQINEQLDITDEIIASAGGVDLDTNIARKSVNVGAQSASVAGYGGGFAGLANSIFSLGTSVYDKDQKNLRNLAKDAEQRKYDLQDLYYDKEC